MKFIEKEQLVSAAPDEVWRAWTTNEGVRSFFAPDSDIELAAPLNEHRGWGVHHDLSDAGIPHEALDRSQAENLPANGFFYRLALRPRRIHTFASEDIVDDGAYLAPDLRPVPKLGFVGDLAQQLFLDGPDDFCALQIHGYTVSIRAHRVPGL